MRRRGFLAGLIGAPVAAQQAVSGRVVTGGAWGSLAPDTPQQLPSDPVRDAMFNLARRRSERHPVGRISDHLPEKYRAMRSWSPVMKVHFATVEERDEADFWRRFYDGELSRGEMLSVLRKAGLWE